MVWDSKTKLDYIVTHSDLQYITWVFQFQLVTELVLKWFILK